MAARGIDPKKVKHYVKLIAAGSPMHPAAKEAQISWATVMRQMKDPYSAISIALMNKGLESTTIPGWEKYPPEARRGIR